MNYRASAPEPAPRRDRTRRCVRWLSLGLALAISFAPLAAMAFARGDRTSHLGDSDTASEYWDITAQFDSGHQLFVRFLITNEGPGDRTAIATWQLIDPNGKRTEFRNGRRKQRWTLSPKGDRIEIGSSIFDQSAAVHRLEYDSTKRGIRVAFEYSPAGPVGWPESASDPYPFDLLELETPVTGTIWLEGMEATATVRGTITIGHTWMADSEADLALRRIEFSSTDASGTSLYLTERMAPSGEREGWLAVARNGKLLHQTADFELELGYSPNAQGGEYPTPSELRIRSSGLDGAIQIGPGLADINPLEAIPQPFRFLLSFKLRPHRVWARASFEVKLLVGQDTPETQLEGSGITTVTYTNPSP